MSVVCDRKIVDFIYSILDFIFDFSSVYFIILLFLDFIILSIAISLFLGCSDSRWHSREWEWRVPCPTEEIQVLDSIPVQSDCYLCGVTVRWRILWYAYEVVI